MISVYGLLAITVGYIGLLFLGSLWAEKREHAGKRVTNNALVYSLSLGVYCTTWTYYGSVGAATTSGMLFLTIYLGPTLMIILWDQVLVKMIRIKNKFQITSLVDLIATRFDKSQSISTIAATLMVTGIVPYIALQIKAISTSFDLMINNGVPAVDSVGSTNSLIIVFLMAIFTIFFGFRSLRLTERHPGLVFAVAVESVLKLVIFVTIGIFATVGVSNGFGEIFDKLPQLVSSNYKLMGFSGISDFANWSTYLILAWSAILFLPRQFRAAVLENSNEKHVASARWMFPSYLFLINLFVIPIAVTGLSMGLNPKLADYFVLAIPLKQGNQALSVLAFLGGFSAAMSMIMVETLQLSALLTNQIVLPLTALLEPKIPQLAKLKSQVLILRRIAALVIIFGAFLYAEIVGNSYALVSIGMISFAAAFQFAPLALAALFWKGASKNGALLALCGGFLVWGYTLMFPAIIKSGWVNSSILTAGPWGISLLRPEALFGFSGLPPLTHALFWTFFVNVGGLVCGSLIWPPSLNETRVAEDFLDPESSDVKLDINGGGIDLAIDYTSKRKTSQQILANYFGEERAEELLVKVETSVFKSPPERFSLLALSEFVNEVERELATVIGGAGAALVLTNSNIFTKEEREKLQQVYSDLLVQLRVSPRDLNRKLGILQQREKSLREQAHTLELLVTLRTQELESQKVRTERANRFSALGEMAAGIAHEINNPLAIIITMLETISRRINKDNIDKTVVNSKLEECIRASERISKIIKSLKTLSRDGEADPAETIAISSVIEDALSLTQRKIETAGIRVSVGAYDDSLKLTCRPVQIVQILTNLLNNARDALESAAPGATDKWIRIGVEASEDWLMISITDSGDGIPPEIAAKIMTPFFTTKPVGKGTGIGLSLSRSLAQKHGGSLDLDLNAKHTRFVLKLPLIKSQTSTSDGGERAEKIAAS